MPFPEPKVMEEFLNNPSEDIDLANLKIPTPSLIQFVVFIQSIIAVIKLIWFNKILLRIPFVTTITICHVS